MTYLIADYRCFSKRDADSKPDRQPQKQNAEIIPGVHRIEKAKELLMALAE